MSEQRTADNTPHVYKYGAPDTCKHCGNRRSHEVHTMTDQQTAATDNALLEKLVREEPLGMLSGCCDSVKLVNPDGPEAAERIKSLQAEVQRTRDYWYRQGKDDAFETYEADRQRMREALVIAVSVADALYEQSGWGSLTEAGMKRLATARQALNPAMQGGE